MDNGWKELDIANLSPDILVGDYEFEVWDTFYNCGWICKTNSTIGILNDCKEGFQYQYRKRAPKEPSHEEIMTKWWKMGDLWVKVISYDLDRETCYCWVESKGYVWGASDCFTGRESADIPPEEV